MEAHRHALQPEAATGVGVTYSEVRDWAVWLNVFTATDMADAMGVDEAVGRRAVLALLWHGICEETGEVINGYPLIRYKPLPPGPREHPHEPAEWETCDKEILSPRGMPVRIRAGLHWRQRMKGGKGADLKRQEREWVRQQQRKKDRDDA